MSPPSHDIWLRHSKNKSHCQYPAEGNDLKTRNCPRGLWGRCSSPLGRETQAPHRLTRRARAPELEHGNPPAVREWQGTVKWPPKSLSNHLVNPKLWGASRTGFCQDKHKRVREVSAWLINATWGSNSGCVHATPQSLPDCDEKFLQLLPLRTRSSKGAPSTLTCPRSGSVSIQDWEHSPLSCHKPTKTPQQVPNLYLHPHRTRGLCLFPVKSSFDTSEFQQRKRRTADKPSRGELGVAVPWWS